MTATAKITVLVADELTLLCDGIAALCEADGRFRVAGQCADGLDAVKMIAALKPQVAILDLELPSLHGAAVVRRVRQSGSDARLLVMATRQNRRTVAEIFRIGANGFLLKSDRAKHLLEALAALASGSIYISPQVRLMEIFAPHRSAPAETPFDGLSPREHQVFSLLVQGLRGKEIAARLDLSPKTINAYQSNLMRKLEIYDVAGLVKFAIQKRLA